MSPFTFVRTQAEHVARITLLRKEFCVPEHIAPFRAQALQVVCRQVLYLQAAYLLATFATLRQSPPSALTRNTEVNIRWPCSCTT
jgi:hypothetical protein